MPTTRVVETASRRPGRCALSSETQGPFIDTGKDVPRFGRIYLSFKWLEPILREHGFIKTSEVEELISEVDRLNDILEDAEEKNERFDELIAVVSEYLPTSEPEVITKQVIQPRKPTDEEIEAWIKERGGNHPVVRAAKTLEKGSSEEWFSLYGNPRKQTAVKQEEPAEALTKEEEVVPDDGPPNVVELFGQNVDLDKILAENVGTIKEFCEEKPEDFLAALVRREFHLAERNNRTVRKGVLASIGYWDDDEDEALYPVDEDDTEEEE